MAQKSFEEERYGDAIQILNRFSQTYPDSPLAAEAMVLRGASHEASGDYKSAARAYLESFSTFPKSAVAPKALMSLGNALVLLGQTDAGCPTPSQVDIRFPDSEYSQKAADRMAELQCSDRSVKRTGRIEFDAAFASGFQNISVLRCLVVGTAWPLLRLHGVLARGVTLSAITIDHNLRESSAEEAAHVAQWCADLGVAHTTRVWRDWDRNGNLQDAARQARYRMINDWRGEIEHILIGHTLDDQAETFVAAAKAEDLV